MTKRRNITVIKVEVKLVKQIESPKAIAIEQVLPHVKESDDVNLQSTTPNNIDLPIKKKTKQSSIDLLFKIISVIILTPLTLLCFLLGLGLSFAPTVLTFVHGFTLERLFLILAFLFIGVILISLSICLFKAIKDLDRETDKHYIMNLSASMTSFAALIISVIALFR